MSVLDNYNLDLVNKAYLIAHRSGSQGHLSRIELAELLVRESIPADLAEQAAADTLLEVINAGKKEGKRLMTYGLYVLGIGIAFMIATVLFFKVSFIIPVGLLLFGSAVSLAGYTRSVRDTL